MSHWTYLKLNTKYGTYVIRIEDIVEVFVHRDLEGADESCILLRHNGKLFLTRDQAEDAIRTMTEVPPL